MLTRELAEDFPTVLAAGVPPAEEGELRDPDVPVTRVPLVRAVSPATDLRALTATRRLLRHHRVALVHSHMAKAGAVGRLAAATVRPRPRTVHTFHGHVLEGYFSPVVERAFVEAERRLAARTDVLIAISGEIRDVLLELGIGRPDQYRVVPLGFDLSSFLEIDGPRGTLRSRLGVSHDVALLAVVGRLAPIKDHALLFEALARLPDVHLAVLGDGEERGSLEALAARLGLTDRVHLVGWWTEVAEALADVDLVVLSSRNEGTPVSLIEAHAAGRAAVATDVGGVRAVVDHGRTGLLVPNEAAAMADAIADLLGDDDRRRAMGVAGREHVRERYSDSRLLRDIRGLYRDLLQG